MFSTTFSPFLDFLKVCRECKVQKVVFCSSGGTVYGKQIIPSTEMTSPQPYIPYAIIKLSMEHFLKYAQEVYGVHYDIYRLSNPYGIYQFFSNTGVGVISYWLQQIINKGKIVTFGNGKNIRDYIFVEDAVTMMCLSLKKKMSDCDCYNLCSGISISLNDLAILFQKYIDHPFQIKYVNPRKSDSTTVALDNEKILKEFSHFELTPLEQGITTMWQYISSVGQEGLISDFLA